MRKTTYNPCAEHESGNAARALAHANTAAMALLGEIAESLRPAHGANWGYVGDAHRVVDELRSLVRFLRNIPEGRAFSVEYDGETIEFPQTPVRGSAWAAHVAAQRGRGR